mmetsp:Transcript_19549/g.65979  ORF Transcript_19549/g.65979 Transcript_19549/m.65979 type:complete len:248 (-) Transcript_19549:117-860(-)
MPGLICSEGRPSCLPTQSAIVPPRECPVSRMRRNSAYRSCAARATSSAARKAVESRSLPGSTWCTFDFQSPRVALPRKATRHVWVCLLYSTATTSVDRERSSLQLRESTPLACSSSSRPPGGAYDALEAAAARPSSVSSKSRDSSRSPRNHDTTATNTAAAAIAAAEPSSSAAAQARRLPPSRSARQTSSPRPLRAATSASAAAAAERRSAGCSAATPRTHEWRWSRPRRSRLTRSGSYGRTRHSTG